MSLNRIILLFLLAGAMKISYGQSKFSVNLELFPLEVANMNWVHSDLEQDGQYAEDVQVSSRNNASMGITLGYDMHERFNLFLNVNAKNTNYGIQYIGYNPLIMGPVTPDKQELYDSWRPSSLEYLYKPAEILNNKWNFFLMDVSLGIEVPLSKRLSVGFALGKIFLQSYTEDFSFKGLSLSLDPEYDNNPNDWLLIRFVYAPIDDDRNTDLYGKVIQETKYFYDPVYYRGTTIKANVSYNIFRTISLTAGVDLTTTKRNNEYYNLRISNTYFQPNVPEFRTYNDISMYSSYFLWRMGIEITIWDGQRGKRYNKKRNKSYLNETNNPT